MTIRGTVKNGKVLLSDPNALEEGAEVEVRPLKSKRNRQKGRPKRTAKSLADRLSKVIGKAEGLPSDAAINHDHYLYGLPKRQ